LDLVMVAEAGRPGGLTSPGPRGTGLDLVMTAQAGRPGGLTSPGPRGTGITSATEDPEDLLTCEDFLR
jgi:hypothetical protein